MSSTEAAIAVALPEVDFRTAQDVVARVSRDLALACSREPRFQFHDFFSTVLLSYPDLPWPILCRLRALDKRWLGAVDAAHPDLREAYGAAHPESFHVPLEFWFNRNPALALPMVQYDDVWIQMHGAVPQLGNVLEVE